MALQKCSFDTLLTGLIGIFLIFLPLTRFLWDPWSQHLSFLFILSVWALIIVDDLWIEKIIPRPYCHPSLTGLILCFTVSAVLSPVKELSRNESINLFNAISIFEITRRLKSPSKLILQKTACALAVVFCLLFIAANHSMGGVPGPNKVEFFINDNLVSSFILLTFFSALEFLSDNKKNLTFWAALLIMTAAFYLTKSFSGLIGAALSSFYLLRLAIGSPPSAQPEDNEVRIRRKKMIKASLIIFPVLLCISLVFFSQYGVQSILNRLHWWSVAFQALLLHPWFGNGPGSFEKISPFFFNSGLKSHFAHNYFLQTASEWGMIAVLFLILFIYNSIRNSNRIFIKAGLIAVLFQNFFDFSMNIPGFFALFCFVLAVGTGTELPNSVWINLKNRGKITKVVQLFFCPIVLFLLSFAAWSFGIKPLIAFRESLKAQSSFNSGYLETTEMHLRKSIEWDKLPAKYYSDLSMVLLMRYKERPQNSQWVQEALSLQKEVLDREPFSTMINQRYRVF